MSKNNKKKNSCWVYAVDHKSGIGSSVWKIWVGKDATDVYIAPHRMAGEFKLSIHRDGNNQLGFYTDHIKRSIRRGDKHFFQRWQRPTAPFFNEQTGWDTLGAVVLDPLEFEPIDPSLIKAATTEIPSPGPDHLVIIFVVETQDLNAAAGLDEFDGFSVLKKFSRKDGGAVGVITVSIPRAVDHLAAVDTDRNGFGWHPPTTKGKEGPFGFLFTNGSWPAFAEYSTNKHAPPPVVPHLRDFQGSVRRWDDAPREYAEMDAFCAVLTCSSDGAELYVDPRSHCDQNHLVADANGLIMSFRLGQANKGWSILADGRFVTAILTQATADDKNLTDYYPNPWKSFLDGGS